MIDCLSNPEWINPQIDFLLFLQNLRIGHLEVFDNFFLSVTIFGEFWLPTLICAIIYWCIDFKAGFYMFTLQSINIFITHLFKMLACVYRPWVLSENIHPSELAVPYAKGYSFPSGHSAMSSSILGGTAYIFRHKLFICLLCIGLILLVGFSRLWLGVHTPQDVICGLLIGITVVFGSNYILKLAEKNKNGDMILMGIINLTAIIVLIYLCCFNQYPADYVSGELLVDPAKSIYLTCIVYSYALGLIDGCFICKRFYPFNPQDVSAKCRIIRGLIGTALVIILAKFLLKYLIMNTFSLYAVVPVIFLSGLSLTLIYPIIFIKYEKSLNIK